jgi:protease-4
MDTGDIYSVRRDPPAQNGPVTASAGPPPEPEAPRRRKASARTGCLLLIAFLLVLVAVAVYLGAGQVSDALRFPGSLRDDGTRDLPERTVMWQGSPYKIAVVDVKGFIASGPLSRGTATPAQVDLELRRAADDPEVVAVVLDMNTPGGEVTASDEMRRAVERFRESGKPVVTAIRALGASGGYMVACATDWIVANRLSTTGSIGVVMTSYNYAELFEKLGLRADVFASGDMKDLLNGARAPRPEERLYVQGLVDESFVEFAAIVAAGREAFADPDQVMAAEFADGRVLSGARALEAGLVDQLGYFEDALEKARDLAGVPQSAVRVIRYGRPVGLASLLLSLSSRQPPSLAGIVPEEWGHVRAGQLYYVMPGVLP